jgi:predicted nucleotidyltransferase
VVADLNPEFSVNHVDTYMIRDGHKLPPHIKTKIPELLDRVAEKSEVVALYAFGSLASGDLKPLSDLDFGILISRMLDKQKRFDDHLDLLGTFNQVLGTDEVDLVMMNDAPMRFSYNIIKSGKLIYCRNITELAEFIEKTIKFYLDFQFFRNAFDNAYLKGIGYSG